MYKVNRYKLISELHRKITKISASSCHTFSAAENKSFLDNLPKRISVTKSDFRQINSEYSALLKLFSRSLNVPQSTIVKSLHDFVLNCKKPEKEASKDVNNNKNDPQHPSFRPDGKHDPPDDEKDPEKEKMLSILSKTFFTMFLVFMFISLIVPPKNRPENATRYVSWNEFVHHMLAVGEVREIIVHPDLEMVTIILYDSPVIKGRRLSTNVFHMAIDTTRFEDKLRDVEKRLGVRDSVSISFDRGGDLAGRILFSLVSLVVILALLSKIRGFKSPLSMDSFSQMGRAKFTLVDPIEGGRGVFFKDVAGLQEAKQEVMEFVDYLKSPERYQKLGAKVPRGALLLGPPGCGKTLLAKAVATEAQVPFLSMNGSEFIEMIGGLGAARVRDLFKEAKKRSPCIIYIDEIDAIGRQRESSGQMGMSSGESEQTLNQLLVEMDGMASKEGVMMLASTNRAEVLDKALLRPGRFDRHIMIDLPNLQERQEIFEKHLSGISLEESPKKYSKRLATLTPGFSGADIANVCNESALHAARNSQKVVGVKNLEYAVERLVGGTEKRSSALVPSERRTVAYHEAGHAIVGWMLPSSDVLLKVTIVPRTSLALGFAQYTPKDQKLYTKENLLDKMCMALGGRAAEAMIFNRITTGAQNDLEKVTQIAYAQIKTFGMNVRVGLVSFPDDSEGNSGTEKPYSKHLQNMIDEEARNMINNAYNITEEVLKVHREKLEKLAETLLIKETLNYDEVVELIGPPLYEAAKKKIEPVEFEDSLNSLSQKNEN